MSGGRELRSAIVMEAVVETTGREAAAKLCLHATTVRARPLRVKRRP